MDNLKAGFYPFLLTMKILINWEAILIKIGAYKNSTFTF
jgi:hypothetical protein